MSDRRPVVGVTAFTEQVLRRGPDRESCRIIGSRYVEAVERVGGVAVLLPARVEVDGAMAAHLVASLDALLLTGGGDIAGHWFGEENHPDIGRVDPARDAFEIALARAALDQSTPLLGVCRGMQVMAVAAGGSVEQHLPDRLGHNDHATGEGGLHRHDVRSLAGTRTHRLLGDSFAASCHHHQGVGRLGPFVESAWSTDGVLEAMELPGTLFTIGIQSHPETIPDDRLFAALVGSALA